MKRARPAFYASVHLLLVGVARDNGYALALHGSMARDLDVLACPWTDDAVSPDKLVRAFAKATGGYIKGDAFSKPHGRLAYVIVLHDDMYLDVSVMPRQV